MKTIMVSLYDHFTPLSSYNIQTKERDIYSLLPYLILKTSKHGMWLLFPFPPLTPPPPLSGEPPLYPLLASPPKLPNTP